MLTELLRLIERGKCRSQFEIARALGVSPGIVTMMANQLAHQGYLEEINSGCSCTDENSSPIANPCSDCPTRKACSFDPAHLWSLTEKGKRAIAV
jgi:hypothetical protein